MSALGLIDIDIEIAMKGDLVGSSSHESVHFLDEVWVVLAAVVVECVNEAPLGKGEWLAMLLGELSPVSQAARAADDPLVPDFLLALRNLGGACLRSHG